MPGIVLATLAAASRSPREPASFFSSSPAEAGHTMNAAIIHAEIRLKKQRMKNPRIRLKNTAAVLTKNADLAALRPATRLERWRTSEIRSSQQRGSFSFWGRVVIQ